MRDLRHRLDASGFDTADDEAGVFGPATTRAVRAFQKHRGLATTGLCDATTWEALVEAGWRLGDRPLYLGAALLRGDDIADLQRRLNAIGFDAGRVDGIFGLRTEAALVDFQRNAGLVADAICGPATVGALARLGNHQALDAVVDVRERERFRCGPRSLAGRSIVVAHTGGLDALATGVARLLTAAGAVARVVQHPDGSEQAAQANAMEADLFLSFSFGEQDGADRCRFAYYRSPAGWESPGGRLLADLLRDHLGALLPCDEHARPMTIPVLRETRMPAVVIELAPAHVVVERTGALAARIPLALEQWITRFGDGH